MHNLGPLTTPVLWLVCLSCLFLAGVRDFTYVCFVASHPLPSAQPIFLVVRERLRPMTDLSDSLPVCLPPVLAECLCGIKLVFFIGMGPASEIRAAQRGQDSGCLVRWATSSGMGGHSLVTHWSQEAEKGHQEQE